MKPFRPPDAWGGGAHTEDEARVLAERAAKMPLDLIDGRWAGAWKRMRADRPPFPKAGPPPSASGPDRAKPVDPYALLGIDARATLDEVKAAFRKKALEHHPDQGGSPTAFMALTRAYEGIVKRRARRRAD